LAFLLAAMALASSAAGGRTVERVHEDGWTLIVRHDRFTTETRCTFRARRRHILVRPGAVGFRLGERHDIVHARYRIDGGLPRRWQDAYAALVAAEVDIGGPATDAGLGGVAWLPVSWVSQARQVAFEAGDSRHVRRFALRALAPILADGQRLGCPQG